MPTVVLLVEHVGRERMQAHAVRILADLGIRIGQKIDAHAGIQRLPGCARIEALERAAELAGDRQIHVPRIARIDEDRVQHRPVGRAADARDALRIDAGDR